MISTTAGEKIFTSKELISNIIVSIPSSCWSSIGKIEILPLSFPELTIISSELTVKSLLNCAVPETVTGKI